MRSCVDEYFCMEAPFRKYTLEGSSCVKRYGLGDMLRKEALSLSRACVPSHWVTVRNNVPRVSIEYLY